MMPVLTTMRSNARAQKRSIPYIFEYYNVDGFFTSPTGLTKGMMGRMFNVICQALNSTHKLPKYVFLIPDIDFLKSTLCHDFGMNLVFEDCVIYFVKEIEKYLNT